MKKIVLFLKTPVTSHLFLLTCLTLNCFLLISQANSAEANIQNTNDDVISCDDESS